VSVCEIQNAAKEAVINYVKYKRYYKVMTDTSNLIFSIIPTNFVSGLSQIGQITKSLINLSSAFCKVSPLWIPLII